MNYPGCVKINTGFFKFSKSVLIQEVYYKSKKTKTGSNRAKTESAKQRPFTMPRRKIDANKEGVSNSKFYKNLLIKKKEVEEIINTLLENQKMEITNALLDSFIEDLTVQTARFPH
jgi:hypothetical protein